MSAAITPSITRLLDEVRRQAEEAGVFGEVALVAGVLRCRARDAAADAWYELAPASGGVTVRMATPDRWLSESIEADLMHNGDPIEELVEDELVELGHDPRRDGAMPTIRHFRSDDRLYTFENVVPCAEALASGDLERAAAMASRYLLAYEAAFRELGDMSGADPE